MEKKNPQDILTRSSCAQQKRNYEVVIIGGGISGVCAAIASARGGASTVLIQDRPVLGGNASSEIRMHICGADFGGSRPNARETGILEELMLENKSRNPHHSFSILDTVLWEKVRKEKNLELFLNTRVIEVTAAENKIQSLRAQQLTSEREYEFTGTIYMDCTGDGMIAAKAGAAARQGREGREEFGEQHAPEKPDKGTMGNSLMFRTKNLGRPVPFKRPDWAYEYTEEDLQFRPHGNRCGGTTDGDIESGYWWIELGGCQDTIADAEEIRDELLKTLYGIWDHIKNKGDHGADNYVLDWIQFLPGKRESRRIEGDYLLKEQDILEGRVFEDAVAYGGWPMDMHPPQGFLFSGEPNHNIYPEKMYTIPYRCYYSRNITNLMMAGRNISTTHMAFGSTRVMGTCAVGGQAAGTAAAMAIKKNCSPRQLGQLYIKELQQQLLRDDCYLPGYINKDPEDLVQSAAAIHCSSQTPKGAAENIRDGHQRNEDSVIHEWISGPVSDKPEWIEIDFGEKKELGEIHIKFDTDLGTEIKPSLSVEVHRKEVAELPLSLVKDYRILARCGEKNVWEANVSGNYQRFCIHEANIQADAIRIEIIKTWGCSCAKIFEIKAFSPGRN